MPKYSLDTTDIELVTQLTRMSICGFLAWSDQMKL